MTNPGPRERHGYGTEKIWFTVPKVARLRNASKFSHKYPGTCTVKMDYAS